MSMTDGQTALETLRLEAEACETLAASTVELLREYAEEGGMLIWVGKPPELVEGENSVKLTELGEKGMRVDAVEGVVEELPEGMRMISVEVSFERSQPASGSLPRSAIAPYLRA